MAEKTIVSRIAENLDWSVRYFASDPSGSMGLLEQMYQDDRTGFIREATRLLGTQADTAGDIAVVAFLIRKGELLPILSHSAVPLPVRVRLATLGLRIDQNLDHTIAARILGDSGERQELLEILSQTRVRSEVVKQFTPLLQDPNPRVHSKLAKLLATIAPEGAFWASALDDHDPRARANAVEALWNQDNEFARGIFHRASQDAHHRVAANAIYGLYLLNDPAALPQIRRLLEHQEGLERLAGLWLVEQTRDPRFLPAMAKLIGKVEPAARSRCLKVLQAVKGYKAEALARGRLDLELTPWRTGAARMSVTTAEGERVTDIRPFEIVPHVDGRLIDDFSLVRRATAPGRTVLLLIGNCPRWKNDWSKSLPTVPGPSRDRFGYLHFQGNGQRLKAEETQTSFRLLGVEVAVAKSDRTPPPTNAPEITWCGNSLASLRRAFDQTRPVSITCEEAIRLAAEQAPGDLHLVVLNEDVAGRTSPSRSGVVLNAVAGARHAAWAEHCEQTGGSYRVAASATEAAQQLVALYHGWQADYEITYPCAESALTVEIYTGKGYGMVGAQGLEPRASSV